MGGGPKAPFYIALLLVVGGLVYYAMNRSDVFAPRGTQEEPTGSGTGLMNEEETREAGRRKERHPICSAGASKEGLVSEQRWS
ncbi:MAG: hypothetical protein FJ147_20740 [Deltaproteobacteria bacterium]|nr:hypothetical protein [Deltaproteobacteria bacterium]